MAILDLDRELEKREKRIIKLAGKEFDLTSIPGGFWPIALGAEKKKGIEAVESLYEAIEYLFRSVNDSVDRDWVKKNVDVETATRIVEFLTESMTKGKNAEK